LLHVLWDLNHETGPGYFLSLEIDDTAQHVHGDPDRVGGDTSS
jgi:hypothetical protein